MALAAHRQHPNRSRELRERVWVRVEQRLAGVTICGRCGATFRTLDELCDANLSETCPGTDAIAAEIAAAEREVGLQ